MNQTESNIDAVGNQPGWCQLLGLEVVDGKLSVVEETEFHGSMATAGVSRFGDTGARFQNEVIGALQFVLTIDFTAVLASDLGRVTIAFDAEDHNIHPASHEALCGSHVHYLSDGSPTDSDDGFKPYSFENYFFFGMLEKKEFAFAVTSEFGSPDGIKADLYIARMGFGKEFHDGGVGV